MSGLYQAEQLTFKILKNMLSTIGRLGELAADNLLDLLNERFSKDLNDPKELNRILNEAVRNNYITRGSRARDATVQLTGKGSLRLDDLLREERFNEIETAKWDGRWRVLSYDVPESNRAARNAVRRLIQQMGFRQLHQSVWIIPYDCAIQIEEIQTAYGAKKHISLLVVDQFDREQEFKKEFDLL